MPPYRRPDPLWILAGFGAALWFSTEFLPIGRLSLSLFWIVVLIAGAGLWRPSRPKFSSDPVVWFSLLILTTIFTLTALAAGFSPPNSADAMAYHLPRVVYWAEQGSVRFFPTPYLNQIMLQPFAEYLMLHTYVISGGDHFINFVQWVASVMTAYAVWRAAGLMGIEVRGRALAAVFAATLPSGILASSGAKNDYFLALWLIVMVCFALLFANTPNTQYAAGLGLALGFALLTKATAYLFAPWPLAALLWNARRKPLLLVSAVIALTVNLPQYLRNYGLSGSPLGFDSAQADGRYRWHNETFGWRQTVSNAVRNLSDQLGARGDSWNEVIYRADLAIHRAIGVDPNDPATTWRDTSFGPPVNANHEANAPNRWHLAILLLAMLFCRDKRSLLYAGSLAVAFIVFGAYLKWQPFLSRLFLPLFILGAPLAGTLARRWRIVPVGVMLLLLLNARSPLVENWVRPLKGPRSVFRVARRDQYFSDMTQWNVKTPYLQMIDSLARSGCQTIGVDINDFQLEYPLMALLRNRNPAIQFVHINVRNASVRYPSPVPAQPCAFAVLTGSLPHAELSPPAGLRLH